MGEAEPAAATATVDEAALVAGLKARRPEAFETLVRTYTPRLLAVAMRMLGSTEDAQDVVQDAMLSAYRSIDRFEGNARVSTWLHRIVVNAALMKLRTRRRKPEQSIEPLLPAFAEDGHHASRPVVAWTTSAEESLLRRETRAQVRAAIAGLPESYRTVLLLRDIEERSTREAATLLGISENALKLRLHRARQALATRLKDAAVVAA
jgi:RNA polymerase sigma-70 factor (ECF subfamily)